MSERRSAVRRRAFLGGRVVFADGSQTYECLVLNFSDTGAELNASGVSLLPATFDLVIPNKARSYRSRICWRKDDWVGVEFLASTSLRA
ncbi:MAG: PilZ domain-containing protein [Beijerinckiaceae bacterium]|nr:PilZ domain-containing protein [Beijerinckiaceae bacterium]